MAKQTRTKQSNPARKQARVPVTARTKALAKRTAAGTGDRRGVVDEDARHAMIAEAAYFRAERRGFSEGGALNDWLEAERQITRILGG